MKNSGMLAAVAAATGNTEAAEHGDFVVDAAFINANFPDVAKALRKEGADAERDRLNGIEKASLPGHEAIIAACKADPTKTQGDAAIAIIAAENAARAAQLGGLDEDEAKVKIRSEPANGADPKAADPKAGKKGVDLWKAEFVESADLQAEFTDEAAYIAFKRAEANGQARILNKKAA